MFSKIPFILIITLLLSVTPAQAVQIEEINTHTSNFILNIEDYKVNMEHGVNDYSPKNNTTTPIINGTGGLAPLSHPETEEGYSNIDVIIIVALVIILLISIYTIWTANSGITKSTQHMHEYYNDITAGNGGPHGIDHANYVSYYGVIDDVGVRLDAAQEMVDQMNENDMYQWCPHMREALTERYDNLGAGYDMVYHNSMEMRAVMEECLNNPHQLPGISNSYPRWIRLGDIVIFTHTHEQLLEPIVMDGRTISLNKQLLWGAIPSCVCSAIGIAYMVIRRYIYKKEDRWF